MEATSILKSLFTKLISNPRHLVLIFETKHVHFTLYATPLSLLIIELHSFISVAALLRKQQAGREMGCCTNRELARMVLIRQLVCLQQLATLRHIITRSRCFETYVCDMRGLVSSIQKVLSAIQ